MGFQNIGCPAGEEFTGSGIKQYLKLYFPQWFNTYNFDNYTNYIFNAEINSNKVDLDLLYNDQPQYLIEKKKANNSFVTAELLNIGHFIEWIEKAFKTNLETDHKPDFFRYKQWFETNDSFHTNSNQEFLLNLKNKTPLSSQQFDGIIFNKIDSLTKEEAMYFLTLMYLDFVKTQDFLHSKFEPLPKEKPIQKTPLEEFFPQLTTEQIKNIKANFSKNRGIELACFVYQMKLDNTLEIFKGSRKKSLTKFLEIFSGIDKNEYEAIRKCFDSKGELINKNYLSQYGTAEKIAASLKVK